MKLSFVIPAYNEEKTLPACLSAVFAEIERSRLRLGTDVEVVVVNNASTDNTKLVAQTFHGVRVVDEMRKGLVWARKCGFENSTGELVANVDSDTIMPRGWLSTVLDEFKDARLVAITGPFIYYDANVFERALVKVWYFPGWAFNLITEPMGRSIMLQGGNFVLRREAWDGVGGYNTNITFYGEDADIARRIRAEGRVLWTWRLPMYASGRRLHEEGFIKSGWVYFVNLLATHLTGKPYTHRYTDVRPAHNPEVQ